MEGTDVFPLGSSEKFTVALAHELQSFGGHSVAF